MKATDYRAAAVVLFAAVLLALTLVPWATAQEPATTNVAAVATTADEVPVQEILRISGWPMYVLVVVSLFAAALVIYFLFVMREEQVVPQALRTALQERIAAGSLHDAHDLCTASPCPLSSVALAGMNYLQTMPDASAELLRDVVEGEGSRQGEAIQGQTRYLMDIASIAPMIGLLGTVLGMVRAFKAIAVDEAMARPLVLADGVRQALYTTAAGLLIAIPVMIAYAFFRERANMLVSRLETASTETLAGLLRERS